MDFFDRSGNRISDWREWTRPKKRGQWRASRSAMELARAWFTSPVPVMPPEVVALLESHNRTRGVILREGWPEHVTRLPFRGEGRNHDLVLIGELGTDRVLISVEAKVDETMGPPVGAYRSKAKSNPKSRAWERIDKLLVAVFGNRASASETPWSQLPYQMLTAMVGTAIEAHSRGCALGVLCVHELITESAKADLVLRNDQDFTAFVAALGVTAPVSGQLYGPFDIRIPGEEVDIPVLLGKAQYRWAEL
jgi:hypothetical protein